ncbi:MAG TPA: polysaccharide deacetylase family protein [Candidatus Acidoferrales bacterium]|nr:polysaccharide deacetylase family protein [Candidatus Acidoferrales bacterium]
MAKAAPFAVFSCDLDTIDRHLQGYGFENLPPCDLIYRTAVPRLLNLLEEAKVPGVMFVIARDAEPQRALLQQVVASGHEVASHSLTHPQPFRTLSDSELEQEVVESRARLSAASDSDVVGFRAPAWDIDDRVLRLVKRAGYSYDASIFPTPALISSRLSAYRRSTGMRSIFAMDLFGHAFAQTRPHRCRRDGTEGLTEFPIAVTPWLRFPVYHTLTYFVPRFVFRRAVRRLLQSNLPVCYEFHAADLLDMSLDGVDPRFSRHPGMKLSLAEKLGSLREVLSMIAGERRVLTYRQALAEGLAGA